MSTKTTSDFAIDFKWVDAQDGVQGAELKATWAELSIIVNGRAITKVYDERLKTTRDFVCLPLYPLAEWLAEQWQYLWSKPAQQSVAATCQTNCSKCFSFVDCREGYALPPVRIEPTGCYFVTVSWLPERLPNCRLNFLEQGTILLENETVKGELSSLVDAVVDRLHTSGITDTYLQQELYNI